MSDVTNIPLESSYSTALTNSVNSTALSIVVDTAPQFALPGGQSFDIVVDPKNNFREVMSVTAIVGTTLTVTRGRPDYSGGPSTAQSHSGGAVVIISDNFNVFSDYATAINSKADNTGDTFTGELLFSGTGHPGIRVNSLTTAQRDALGAPVNGNIIYNTTAGE